MRNLFFCTGVMIDDDNPVKLEVSYVHLCFGIGQSVNPNFSLVWNIEIRAAVEEVLYGLFLNFPPINGLTGRHRKAQLPVGNCPLDASSYHFVSFCYNNNSSNSDVDFQCFCFIDLLLTPSLLPRSFHRPFTSIPSVPNCYPYLYVRLVLTNEIPFSFFRLTLSLYLSLSLPPLLYPTAIHIYFCFISFGLFLAFFTFISLFSFQSASFFYSTLIYFTPENYEGYSPRSLT